MSPDNPIVEEYTDSKYLKILVSEQLGIPGLGLFGRQVRRAAIDSLPPHHHNRFFEIVYVASGNPSFSVGGKLYTLTGGDVFFTRPYEMHSTSSMPVSVSELYWIQLDLTECPNSLFLDRSATDFLFGDLIHLDTPVISTDLVQMKKLIQQAFQMAQTRDHPYLTAQYLTLFLFVMLEYSRYAVSELTADIQLAVNFIREHITEKITLEGLANLCYLSVSQFKQKFKRQMGMAPRQFINFQKTEHAKTLLRRGYTTSQAAEALHFESPSYFITVFRRYTSCTPGEYRKQPRENSSG